MHGTKSNTNTDISYTIFSKYLIYKGFEVIEKLCYRQTAQNTEVLHAMVVAFKNVWSLFQQIVDELTRR